MMRPMDVRRSLRKRAAREYYELLHPRACSDSLAGAPCVCKFVNSDASDELAEGGPLILYTRRLTFRNL